MAADRIVPKLQVVALFFLCLSIRTSSDDPSLYPSKFGWSTPHVYTRFADVERRCQSVLSSAAELRDGGADSVSFQMENLSFMNGEWSQDAGQAPLLPPLQGIHAGAAIAGGPHEEQPEAVNLASFLVTHIEKAPRRGARTALNVSGVLTLSVARNCCCSSSEMEGRAARTPEFVLRPGIAKLHIQLEGVYTETGPSSGAASDDGESVLCMVGNAVLPVRGGNSSDPWWELGRNQRVNSEASPPVTADENVLLVLRYPKTRTLATRAVRGEMTSTGPPPKSAAGGAYFDAVRLVALLHRYYSRYRFRPQGEELDGASSGCGTDPTHSVSDGGAGHLFRGSGAAFCDILRQFVPEHYGVMDVIPDWNCNSNANDESCDPLGPFGTTRPATSTAASTRPAAVAVQGVECEPDGAAGARVSAVFRLLPPWEHHPTAAKRSGLGRATLSAEGAWTASTGRLCMVACRGGDDVGKEKEKDACGHRVTMYVPTAFSVTRRAIVEGQIASKDQSHSPISFRQQVSPRHHWQQQFGRAGETMRVAYNYTVVEQATDLLLRHSLKVNFRDTFIARSFLSYPKAEDDMASLSNLGEDLGLRFRLSSPKPRFVPDWIEEPFFQLQVLSVGSLVGTFQPPYQYQQGEQLSMPFRFQQQSSARYGMEMQDVPILDAEKPEVLLNVSAEFTAPSWKFFDSRSVLSLEGVYNPADGRMHLVGCRHVHAPSAAASREDLEDGMDCSVEVTVEYPSTTTRWLLSPVAKVGVASTRYAGDPLHFNATELRSLPIVYRDQRTELAEPRVEGLLCAAVLSAAVASAASQLLHVKSHPDVAPYVSLAALGVQALGYVATLVADARTLPAWPTSGHRYIGFHDRVQWDLDCAVKALTLAALLLTARLAHKVQRARAKARARSPLDPWRVPGDARVVLYSLVAYLGGLFLVLAAHWPPPGVPDVVVYQQAQQGPQPSSYTRRASLYARSAVVVGWYLGVAKEWFLLPQVLGNAVWRVNCKPLAARFYAGATAAWLLPHIYGYLRPPVVNPEEALQYGASLDFYPSKALAVAVPAIGVVLAVAVYVQQRWNYSILGWVMKSRPNKLQHVY